MRQRRVFLFILVMLFSAVNAEAVTRYISPTGNNANSGQTTTTPWKTWAHAFANTTCGDTLIVLDGTYTVPANGRASLTKTCTATTRYTIQWQNERVGLISGDGATYEFRIINSSYITIDGMRLKSLDNVSGGSAGALEIRDSSFVIVRDSLFYENNGYQNAHLLWAIGVTDSVFEDLEFYTYHRHGFQIGGTGSGLGLRNTVRRVYCNSRGKADKPGGWVSGDQSRGDTCISLYPATDTIVENVFGEDVSALVDIQAFLKSERNKVLGSAILGDRIGTGKALYVFPILARGNTVNQQPQHTTVENVVGVNLGGAISGGGHGIYSRGAWNTQVKNVTIINPLVSGFTADQVPTATGGGTQSFFCTNCLAMDSESIGFRIDTSTVDDWKLDYTLSYNNVTPYSPPEPHPNITNSLPVIPNGLVLGTCYLWIPADSVLKGTGLGGADIGANILYRYVDGTLTTTPLWTKPSGAFPHRAVIAGVNSDPTNSANGMHTRFRVNNGGCAFPAGY